MGVLLLSKEVIIRQRLEELKIYVYDELNRLKTEIHESCCGDIKARDCKEKHQKSYRRTRSNSGRKYRH